MKKWYMSKTLWTNIIAIVAILAQTYTGRDVIPAEIQVTILGIVNLFLRAITKEQIEW